MKITRSQTSLIGQIVAVNVLLVVATLFAATAAASLNLGLSDERFSFALLALTIILVLLVNMLMLRRRFSPLEELIARVESVDPAQVPEDFDLPAGNGKAADEVARLAGSFRRLLARVEDERQRSGRLVLQAQEEERRRLARDLHDEVNQALTAILLRLEALSHDAPAELDDEFGEVKRLVNQAMSELLQLARQLRPTALDDHGLVPALATHVRRFASQTGIDADLRTRGHASELEADQEIAIYRVAQEALANVARHAGASRVEVDFDVGTEALELRVRDDGCGFDASGRGTGLGLDGMAERARLVGGELTIESHIGRGTELVMRVP
ncbi:MAG: two-component system, NarL family, sensor histidine kinase UhpB [Thermoleophilaceae bacterium]|jgi:two-component system sensor histidine kinase UhpB|nr:two-component system, NarL family, sensor histidine kinase UhpB [Thermoleophilaceae bacterium]